MDVSKISQQQTYAKFGKEYVDGAQEGLMLRDSNGDGQVSAIEMYKDTAEGWGSIFEGHEKFSERAEELNIAQGEIYAQYAGSDGVLDKFEFVEALNSDEMDVLLRELWEMKNEKEAMDGETDIRGLARYDMEGNNDGQTSAVEIYKSKAELNEQKYGDNPDIQAKADEISMRKAEILNKFAGEDGVLTSKEYAAGVQSDEYQETMREYSALLDFYNWIFNK